MTYVSNKCSVILVVVISSDLDTKPKTSRSQGFCKKDLGTIVFLLSSSKTVGVSLNLFLVIFFSSSVVENKINTQR